MSQAARTGLREAHAHLGALGEWLVTPSLASCESVEACLDRVRRAVAEARRGAWVRFLGARVEAWREPRWPTMAELDEATGGVGGTPCVIKSFDHHAAVCNSAALAGAGLGAGARVGANGVVLADGGGRATGMLVEQAAWVVWEAAPSPGPGERRAWVRAALDHLRSLGYAQVHDMLSQAWLGPVLAGLHDAGEAVMPVWLYAPAEDAGAFAERPWERPGVRFAGLKAFADGTLNSRTAYMTVAYREPASVAHAAPGAWFGKAMMTPVELESAMSRAAAMGVGLAVHAIGDGAVRMVLDAWEARGGGRGGAAANGTPALRIEHAELIDAADVPRFARLGVTCSVQPCHLLCDVEALTRYLPHRLDRVLPLRELIDAGCRPGELLWFGSDAPIVPADPMDSVTAATKRRRPGMGEHEAIAWGQRIEADEAWSAFCSRADGG